MSDCPDCEKKEAAEKSEKVALEWNKETQKKLVWSIARVVGLTVILAVILFLFMRKDIARYWYEDRESGTVKAMIEEKLNAGLGDSGYTYEIKYCDEGEQNQNYYRVSIFDKDGKPAINVNAEENYFDMAPQYDTVKGELKIMFADQVGSGVPQTYEEGKWLSVLRKTNPEAYNKAIESKTAKAKAEAEKAEAEAKAEVEAKAEEAK